MKKLLFTLFVVAVSANIIVTFNTSSINEEVTISNSLFEVAHAQSGGSESGGSTTYYSTSTTSGSTSGTYTLIDQDGGTETCSFSYDYTRISCHGTGILSCSESETQSNLVENCS